MPMHLAAFYSSSIDGTGGYASLTALTDPLLQVGSTTLQPPRDMQLLAAVAGGSGISHARIEAPSLLRVASPAIVPLNASLTVGSIPEVCDMSSRPIALAAGEDVSLSIRNAAAAAAFGLLVLGRELTPAPPGEAFWVRYYKSGASVSAGAWASYAEVDWEQTLPSGTYAIVGMDHLSTSAIAARLLLPDSRYRPGAFAHTDAAANHASPVFYDGRLGLYGYFTSRRLPGVEVLCSATQTEDFEGWLRVVRVGGLDAMPPPSRG